MNNRLLAQKKYFHKQIKWERYIDPLYSSLDEQNDDAPSLHSLLTGKHKVLHTPMGLLSATNDALASNSIDMWIMHTNFDVTPKVIQSIRNIDGVETINVLTRYKIRVGFPKSGLFNINEIKHNIELAIKNLDKTQKLEDMENFPADIKENVGNIIDMLYNKNKPWAIVVLPNGKLDILIGNDYDDEFLNQVNLRKQTQSLIGSVVIQNNA